MAFGVDFTLLVESVTVAVVHEQPGAKSRLVTVHQAVSSAVGSCGIRKVAFHFVPVGEAVAVGICLRIYQHMVPARPFKSVAVQVVDRPRTEVHRHGTKPFGRKPVECIRPCSCSLTAVARELFTRRSAASTLALVPGMLRSLPRGQW